MQYAHTLVNLSILLIIYNYAIYPVAVIGLAKLFFRRPEDDKYDDSDGDLSVTFVIAAYNEERVIERKIKNTLGLDYPESKLEILVVADGSDDRTPELVENYRDKGVRLLFNKERRGKTSALNRAVESANGEIIVFSDANNDFRKDAVKKLVRHFKNPSVGGVCGSKKIRLNEIRESSEGDSLYWRYESAIKSAESAIGSITGADGEIFAVRKSLYKIMNEKVINDDAELTLSLIQQGYRVLYDTEAESWEEASINIVDDFNVKVRMVAGGFQTISRWPVETLLPLTWHSFAFFSHKVLRWVVPELMLVALLGTCLLSGQAIYKTLFILQLPFYALAITGWLLRKKGQLPTFIYVPYYLFTMNMAAFVGLMKYVRGRQSTVWKKAQR